MELGSGWGKFRVQHVHLQPYLFPYHAKLVPRSKSKRWILKCLRGTHVRVGLEWSMKRGRNGLWANTGISFELKVIKHEMRLNCDGRSLHLHNEQFSSPFSIPHLLSLTIYRISFMCRLWRGAKKKIGQLRFGSSVVHPQAWQCVGLQSIVSSCCYYCCCVAQLANLLPSLFT